MQDRKEIGQMLQQLRKQASLEQSDVAQIMGIDRSHISKIENGKYDTKIETVTAFADALGMKITFVEK